MEGNIVSDEGNDFSGYEPKDNTLNQGESHSGFDNQGLGEFSKDGFNDSSGSYGGANSLYGSGYENPYNTRPAGYERPMTVGQWLITLLLLMIPCVNIVMVFVWAFGSGVQTTKQNFFRAELILALIMIVIIILIGLIAPGLLLSGLA